MAGKREVVGVVRRNKLDKGVVVAVERRVRNVAYGKIQRRTGIRLSGYSPIPYVTQRSNPATQRP